MLKHITLFPLICGLIIGIVAILFSKQTQNIVYKYPTPETASKLIYKDKSGVCYKYNAINVECDKNESRLKDFPLNK
jgi:hypothetical protein